MKIHRVVAAGLAGSFLLAGSAVRAQFEDVKTSGARLDKTVVEKIKIGMIVTAQGGPCNGMVGTVPVPTEWTEQKVQILREDVTPNVTKVEYRPLAAGTAKQMVVNIGHLKPGDVAHALVTFEITRRTILPPEDTSIFKIAPHPEKEKDAAAYLAPSPLHREPASEDRRVRQGSNRGEGELGEGRGNLRRGPRQDHIQKWRFRKDAQGPDRRNRRLRRVFVAVHRDVPSG